jgi:hypothetical protein
MTGASPERDKGPTADLAAGPVRGKQGPERAMHRRVWFTGDWERPEADPKSLTSRSGRLVELYQLAHSCDRQQRARNATWIDTPDNARPDNDLTLYFAGLTEG